MQKRLYLNNKLIRVVSILIVNIVIFFVLMETATLALYFFSSGELFYMRSQNYETIQSTEANENPTLTGHRLHPYFGFVTEPGRTFIPAAHQMVKFEKEEGERIQPQMWEAVKTNNHGFYSLYDYPVLKRDEDQHIIGIFGGSVALWAYVVGRERLEENLKNADFFNDKEIIILNFAMPAFKQPQQLQILTYFLSIGQEFDMVINIDGYNDVVGALENNTVGLDISIPAHSIMTSLQEIINQTTMTPEKIESLSKIVRKRALLNNLTQKISSINLASVNFILKRVYATTLSDYTAELVNYQKLLESNAADVSLIYLKPADVKQSIPLEDAVELWANSSSIMNEVLTGRGATYFHFLQPNQYYRTKRVFSPAEEEVAFNESRRNDSIEKGYPELLGAATFFEQKNITFSNATEIFDDEPKPVYLDNCCHYLLLGNNILVDFIANAILESKIYEE